MPVDADAILSLAVDLATQAAAVHADGRKTQLRVEEKGSPFSLVTQVDREAERVIVDGIRATRPDDEILGEEGTSVPGSSDVRWLVDPVDGTTNYVYGYAAYSVSIGVEIDGQPAVGVVFDTGRHVLYTAVRGRGATANGDPIEASDKDELATALIATGFAFDPALRTRQGETLTKILARVRDIRRSGSASIDLLSLATGTVDAYYEGGNVVVAVSDDGRGLDLEKLYAKGVEAGVVEPGTKLSEAETYALIFRPGFSTASEITVLRLT